MKKTDQLQGYVVHSTPGRCRIKIPAKRNDKDYFDALKNAVSTQAGVTQVEINPVTAAILVVYNQTLINQEQITEYLRSQGQFQPGTEEQIPTTTLWEKANAALEALDRQLLQGTAGQIDVRSLLFVVLVVSAIRQLRQGAVFGPSATLFWYALGLLMSGKK